MARLLPLLLLTACAGAAAQEKPVQEKKMKHTNRLAKEKSPYLLQHAHNPVDWYPWGQEAFDKAKKEGKPIFLSIGYSTCHWCHVMERQSFEDEEVAKVLNEHFVPIKVDREERPDVDQIYMTFVQASSGHGGWPLSAWLTPDLKPFVGGTYYPKDRFLGLLDRIREVWKEKRAAIEEDAERAADFLKGATEPKETGAVDADEVLKKAYAQFEQQFEPSFGGFSTAPKFPHSTTIQALLRHHRRTGSAEALAMAEKSLTEMAKGGIYDQLGGGFHRYSTDATWTVPHFEKMLYDNALLVTAYLEAYLVTKNEFYARIARETLEYVRRDMTSKEGGFYSAEDADSEHIEGKFYVWNPKQVRELLPEKDAERFMKAYDVTDGGNWDPHEPDLPKHQSVLRVVGEVDEALRKKMFEARSKRVRPGLDDKVLTSWNGLMISAFAQAAQVLGDAAYRESAERAARFLLEKHRKDGKLLRTSRHGEAKIEGYLDDYAYLAAALLDLYETTFDAAYYDEARRLAEKAVELFGDAKSGGFYATAKDHTSLIARMREEHEGATPSANGVLALVFLRLHGTTGEAAHRERAVKTAESFKTILGRFPAAHVTLVMAVDWMKGPAREIVVAGPDPAPFLKAVRGRFLPNKVVALADGKSKMPLLEGKGAVQGKTAAYVCENRACQLPVTDPAALEEQLKK
jgi:uncharacterized protein YyaL (SSP411 family)